MADWVRWSSVASRKGPARRCQPSQLIIVRRSPYLGARFAGARFSPFSGSTITGLWISAGMVSKLDTSFVTGGSGLPAVISALGRP